MRVTVTYPRDQRDHTEEKGQDHGYQLEGRSSNNISSLVGLWDSAECFRLRGESIVKAREREAIVGASAIDALSRVRDDLCELEQLRMRSGCKGSCHSANRAQVVVVANFMTGCAIL
jgi:hypothetical protein